LAAIIRPDFTVEAQIVSQKTSTLRCAGISSPSPRLSLERKHGQIACWMTVARKRRRLPEFRAIGLSPEADDPGLWRDGSAQA
jgi:hypothetical protein